MVTRSPPGRQPQVYSKLWILERILAYSFLRGTHRMSHLHVYQYLLELGGQRPGGKAVWISQAMTKSFESGSDSLGIFDHITVPLIHILSFTFKISYTVGSSCIPRITITTILAHTLLFSNMVEEQRTTWYSFRALQVSLEPKSFTCLYPSPGMYTMPSP